MLSMAYVLSVSLALLIMFESTVAPPVGTIECRNNNIDETIDCWTPCKANKGLTKPRCKNYKRPKRVNTANPNGVKKTCTTSLRLAGISKRCAPVNGIVNNNGEISLVPDCDMVTDWVNTKRCYYEGEQATGRGQTSKGKCEDIQLTVQQKGGTAHHYIPLPKNPRTRITGGETNDGTSFMVQVGSTFKRRRYCVHAPDQHFLTRWMQSHMSPEIHPPISLINANAVQHINHDWKKHLAAKEGGGGVVRFRANAYGAIRQANQEVLQLVAGNDPLDVPPQAAITAGQGSYPGAFLNPRLVDRVSESSVIDIDMDEEDFGVARITKGSVPQTEGGPATGERDLIEWHAVEHPVAKIEMHNIYGEHDDDFFEQFYPKQHSESYGLFRLEIVFFIIAGMVIFLFLMIICFIMGIIAYYAKKEIPHSFDLI